MAEFYQYLAYFCIAESKRLDLRLHLKYHFDLKLVPFETKTGHTSLVMPGQRVISIAKQQASLDRKA